MQIYQFTYFERMPFFSHQLQEWNSTCRGKQSKEDDE